MELQELCNAFGYILTEERSIQAGAPAHVDLQRFRAYLHALGLDTEEEPRPDEEDDLRNRGIARIVPSRKKVSASSLPPCR